MAAQRYRVTIPGEDYWRRQIKCQTACPVGTDARGYVRAIAEGDYDRAYQIARGPNPLASICGRICAAPCEAACRRGAIDQPVAIRALKRFAADRSGPRFPREGFSGDCESAEEMSRLARFLASREHRQPEHGRVAIIGSGPAGLAAAHDLALLGARPVVFEMERRPAGMLYTGVPAYRLPRDLIDAEIEVIRSLGVEFRCGVEIGRDVSFPSLRADFDAVIIAGGAKRARMLALPGADAEGIWGGVDFLRAAALGESVRLGQRVVVIGGGNVAYDVSRTVLRPLDAGDGPYVGADAERTVAGQTQSDVSRVAARQGSVGEVHLFSLEARADMPADETEIVEGEQEGVQLHNGWGPQAFLWEERDGRKRVTGVRFMKVLRVFDESGRFSPQYDESDTTEIPADSVLLSVGQSPDLTFLEAERDGVDLSPRGLPVVDPKTLETTAPGVFAAGDVLRGAGLMIEAIAEGKKVARSVYRRLTGIEIGFEEAQFHFNLADYHRERGYERRTRLSVPTASPADRIQDAQQAVELGYSESEARLEAERCLDCGVNTIFDGEKCILCAGCVDVCPTLCLKLVTLENLEPGGDLEALTAPLEGQGDYSAIIKDEERCIRCALCAERCPTGAITMERFQFRQEWSPCLVQIQS